MVIDKEQNDATFRELANMYMVSHTTCWRIYHDVKDLLNTMHLPFH